MRSIEEKREIASQMAEEYLTPGQRKALNLKDIGDSVVQKAWERADVQHGGRRRRRKTRRRRKKKGRRKTRAQRGGMEPVTALIILTLLFIIYSLAPPSDGLRADGTPFGFRRAATRRVLSEAQVRAWRPRRRF